jgi:putative transposase
MHFQKGYIYHIYNQGNNQRKIFLDRENFLFFLTKINKYILPYADILAWCLMPNHFHLMVLVNELEKEINDNDGNMNRLIASQTKVSNKSRSLNDSIAIMLRSYTRAFNNMHGFTGKLFRERTKCECVNCPEGVAPTFFVNQGVALINTKNPELQYPQVCFNYIHQNPVKAELVKQATDWEFSSARDFAGMRKGKLVNISLAKEYVKIGL